MVMPILIKLIETPPPSAMRRAHPEILRDTYQAEAVEWSEKMLPRHFEPPAAERYGYQPRSPRTIAAKAAAAQRGAALLIGGAVVDDVWTGLMMRAVLGHQDIAATAIKSTVRMFGPTYLYAYRKDYKQPDKAAEITAVAADEIAQLEETADRVYTAGAAKIKETTTTTIGGPAQ